MKKLLKLLPATLAVASFLVLSLSYPYEQNLTQDEIEFISSYTEIEPSPLTLDQAE